MEYTTDFDRLFAELKSSPVDPQTLVSKNADENTKKLFEYLKSNYGSHILAGQQYLQEKELEDWVYYDLTGTLPAIRGYDMMDINKTGCVHQWERALEWAKKSGCIITLCWHWYAPDDIDDPEGSVWAFYYRTTDYDRKTSFDILKAVTPGTKEYDFVIDQIDRAAAALREFEKAGIPVLWRPLHEAAGNWFWWGRRDFDTKNSVIAYKKLWYMIFDRLENLHKLTNLIWVWNGQAEEMAVNPNTYDFCGEDIYSTLPLDHSSQKEKYLEVTSYTHGKMAALSECGYMPDPKNLKKDGVKWLWWLPWWGSFVYKIGENRKPVFDDKGRPLPNNEKFTNESLKSFFENDYCITLDKLPWFNDKNREFVQRSIKERFGE